VDRGAACAAWTTSAWPLYARYGGGVATFAAARQIEDVPSVRIESPLTGKVELAASAEVGERIVALHERACRRPGSVPRDVRYWRERLRRADLGFSLDVLDASASAPPAMYALRRPAGDEDPDGCAMYRVHQRWDGGLCWSELEILDLVAVDDDAAADLWRFLLRLDLVDRLVIGHGPVDTALRWLLNDGRRLRTTAVFDHVWLRVLDAERVLAARTYPALGEPLLLAVRDPLGLCDGGTFLIESDGASTSVSPAEPHAAQIEVDVALLSMVLLGSGSIRELAAAGRLLDLDERQVRLLQHAFSAERVPYCDNSF
jgi:predicted acetyltransferase